MKYAPSALWKAWISLFEEEPADEPRFDPAQLAETLVASIVVIGALYWLIWGAMVYEGGLDRKLAALASGGRGDALEGLFGNVMCALGLSGVAATLLLADRRGRRKR